MISRGFLLQVLSPVSGLWKPCTVPLCVQVPGGTVPWALALHWEEVFRMVVVVVTLFICLWESSNDPVAGREIVSSGHRLRTLLCHQLLS